jgi:PAS domain S-box-containing protein
MQDENLSKQLLFNQAWARYAVAVLFVGLAAGMRIWPLHSLGSTLAWLTFYPAIMVAAIYSGLLAGLLATALSCFIVLFCWQILVAEPFISDLPGWLGMSVFVLTCSMISVLAEAMRRAQARALKAQVQTEAANIMLNQNALNLNKYSALIESSDDAIIGKTLDGFITSWNGGAERIFGYTPNEILGHSIHILIPEQYQHEETAFLNKIRMGIVIKHYETVRKRKDGKLIDISVTLSPIHNIDGNIVGVSKIAHDITSRKLADELLRNSEERYRALFENMLDGFAYCKVRFEDGKPCDLTYLNVNNRYALGSGLTFQHL